MIPHQRGTGRAEDSLYPDDHEEHSNSHTPTLLGSEQEGSLLSAEEDEEHALEVSSWKNLPWWKRPSPCWLIFASTCRAIANSAGVAPTVTLYTDVVCRVHRPEYVMDDQRFLAFPLTNTLAQTSTIVPIPQVSNDVKTIDEGVFVHLPNDAYLSARSATLDYTQVDEKKCASDPVVQATVAKLQAVLYTTMGILSCLTTSWWGSLSDRHGRRIVIFASALGSLAINVVQMITVSYVDVLPGQYWFALVGPVIDGLCGGVSTTVAMKQSYLADTTDPSTRSLYFSLSLGLTYIGEAVGPVLGGLLIRATGSILPVFYFVAISYGLYAIAILLILPESLTRARARGARLRRRKMVVNKVSGGRTPIVLKMMTSFLSPFLVLLPEAMSSENPLKRKRKDWSLLYIAVAYGFSASIVGSVSYNLQYAVAQFNWTSEIASYFLSFLGVTRALFLVAILPLIVKCFQLRASSLTGSGQTNACKQTRTSTSFAFDLTLARVSAALWGVEYLGMAVASTGTLYALANAMGSLGVGLCPTMDSLALKVYSNKRSQDRNEAGKLFGAFSVISALSAGIISSALYGFVYSSTVAVFPQAIMIVSMCTSCLAFFLLLLVHVPSDPIEDRASPIEHGNEEESQRMVTPEILVAMGDEEAEE